MALPSLQAHQPPALTLLPLLLGPLLLLAALVRRWRRPSPPTVRALPSLLELYGRVAAGAFKPKLPKSLEGHAPIRVAVGQPFVVDPARLAAYLELVELRVPADGAGGSAGAGAGVDAPAGFLFAESFRVGMLAMAQPSFPFNVLGAVLSRSVLRLERPVRSGDALLLSAAVDPASYVRNAKGDVEAVLATAARDAATGAAVWSSELTVLVLDPRRRRPPPQAGKGPEAAAAGAKGEAAAAAAAAEDEEPFLVLAPRLKIGGDAGRRYGAFSGDRNPIHLCAATASLFGFRRPIAHAMYLVGCMEAALRGYEGPGGAGAAGSAGAAGGGAKGRWPFGAPAYPLSLESEFRRPTAIPATLRAVLPVAPAGGDEVVRVSVVEARGSGYKDVVVGTLRQGAKAAGKP